MKVTMIDLLKRLKALPNPYRALAMNDFREALRDLALHPPQRARIVSDFASVVEQYEQDATEWLMEVSQ